MAFSSSASKRQFSVGVIGGGIGGLVAAIALKLSGQNVTVVEQRSKHSSTTAGVRQGLQQTDNAKLCLFALGLEKAILDAADTGYNVQAKRYSDGHVINLIEKKRSFSMIHRSDLLRILYERAVEVGVDFINEQTFDSIEETAESVKIQLGSGKVLQADLLVGADGVHSKVRRHIPSTKDVRPSPTGDCVFLVDVSKSVMDKHPSTAELYRSGQEPLHLYVGPQRCIVSWTMNSRELYHLQICDFAYGDGGAYGVSETDTSPFVSMFTNMPAFRERYSDHEEAIKHILKETEVCTKWIIADTPLNMPWTSPHNRIVLLGDAAHTFEPFAGQGAAMAVEDAAVLAKLVSRASSDLSLSLEAIAPAYEAIRKPRVNAVRAIVKANIQIFGMADGKAQEERDKSISGSGFSGRTKENDSEKEGPYKGAAKWSTEDAYRFTEGADVIREAEEYVFPGTGGEGRESRM